MTASGFGCDQGPPSSNGDGTDTEPTPSCAQGEAYVCEDSRGCIRLDQDGSFENDFSGHWEGDLNDSDESEEDTRRVTSVTAIVDDDNDEATEPVTLTVRPCDSRMMLSFRGEPDQFGVGQFVSQEIDVSQHTPHISDRSRLVVQALFNVMPGNERFGFGSGFDIAMQAFRDGDVVVELGPDNFFQLPQGPGRSAISDPSTWSLDWVEMPLRSGVDAVEVQVRGLPEPRPIDHFFVDDVRIWLVLNAPDAELALSMAVDRSSAFVNQIVAFTLTVTNLGSETATDVGVFVSLPGELQYESQSGDGVFNPINGLWSVDLGEATPTGTLLHGFSASVTINAKVNSLQVTTVTTNASISSGLLGDFNANDNTASASVAINQVVEDPGTPNEGQVEHGCRDGVDNDGDGLVDCEDPQCLGRADCPETCSNGTVDTDFGEECDDGNLTNGDGCSAMCLLE
jgi:uncharacterized repeat protein (TIGR01451 family)